MKSGTCPKCGQTEVYRHEGSRLASEQVMLNDAILFNKATSPDKYVCAACGYLEYYVPSQEHLDLIRKEWEKVAGH
jgi:predicted RNA-binding Zn-ribbon protein involved in translation (DUF1610 family)